MALTITKRPQEFTPAGSPIFWQIETDDADMVYFEVEVIEPTSGATLFTGKIVPTPRLQNGAYIDLSTILSAAVDWEVDNTTTLVVEMTKPVFAYRVKFKEKKLSGSTIVDGLTYNNTSDINYVYHATFDKISFSSYDDDDYVIRPANQNVKFLTNKPDGAYVNKASAEYLYTLTDLYDTLRLKVTIYSAAGSVVHTHYENFVTNGNMYRFNIGMKAIKAATSQTMLEGQYYTVQVFSTSGQPMTEMRTYNVKDAECHLELVNLFWVNNFGGIDSYQFVNPTDNLTVTKTQMKKETYRVDNGLYSYLTGDVYNVQDEIINSKPQVKVNINTRILTDDEVFWLGGLIMSKQVFVELTDANLVPVVMNDNSFNYQRTKYLQNALNVMRFSFSFAEWFIPALSNGVVSYIVSATYYNKTRTGSFQKQGCTSPAFYGSTVIYTVPAGTYSSDISQADADALADADIAANGQAYANANGTCLASPLIGNEAQSGTFYSTGCGAGSLPVPYVYTVPAGTYTAYTLADANNLAIADVAANGQAYADTFGDCGIAIGNQIQSMIFYSSVCASNETAEPYTVTVPANTYFALTQSAANQLAVDWIMANGQAEADANGLCTMSAVALLSPQVIMQAGSFGYDDYYLYVDSSQAIMDNILIHFSGDYGGSQILLPTLSMSIGDTQSYQIWIGQFMTGDTMTVNISSVSPNPGGSGMIYQY